jgi:hypothetical protein
VVVCFHYLDCVDTAFRKDEERARSFRIWLWIAAFVGALAPLALLILGDAEHPAQANWETSKINRVSIVGKEAVA